MFPFAKITLRMVARVVKSVYDHVATEHLSFPATISEVQQLRMVSILRAYNAALLRRPMATQCATAGLLFGGGDILAQQVVERRGREHDFARTARLTFYGGALFGPLLTKWYQFLGRLKFASPVRAVVYRTWLDQAILTPPAVVFFFTGMTFLEGKGVGEATRRVEQAYVPTLLRNWSVFIPTQIINFAVVPAHLRFVFMSVVSLFWNTYLSYANQRAKMLAGTQQDVAHLDFTPDSDSDKTYTQS